VGRAFAALTESFGRPVARQWLGRSGVRGPGVGLGAALGDARARVVEVGQLDDALEPARGMHSAVLAFDAAAWESMRFARWEQELAANGWRAQVLHMSRPGLAAVIPSRVGELKVPGASRRGTASRSSYPSGG
jgi:hypothetical protein